MKTRHNASASLSSFLSYFFLFARAFSLCLFQILFRIPPLSRNSFISLSCFRDGVLFFLTCSSFSVHQLAYLCSFSFLFLSTLAWVIFVFSIVLCHSCKCFDSLQLSFSFYLFVHLSLSLSFPLFYFHFFPGSSISFSPCSGLRLRSTCIHGEIDRPKRSKENE